LGPGRPRPRTPLARFQRAPRPFHRLALAFFIRCNSGTSLSSLLSSVSPSTLLIVVFSVCRFFFPTERNPLLICARAPVCSFLHLFLFSPFRPGSILAMLHHCLCLFSAAFFLSSTFPSLLLLCDPPHGVTPPTQRGQGSCSFLSSLPKNFACRRFLSPELPPF